MTNNWQQSFISAQFQITNGSTNTDDAVDSGQFPLFDRSVTVKLSDKFLFDTEAVIIPGEGKDFTPRYYKGKFDLHQRAYAIFPKPNDNEVDVKYLYYWIDFNKSYLIKMAVGSTVKSLRMYMLEKFPLVVPSKPVQHKIVDLLTSLDEATQKTDQIIQKTEQLKRGLLVELIGKHLDKNTSTNWKMSRLADVCDLITDGKHGDCQNEQDSGYYFISSKDIHDGIIDYNNTRQITMGDFEEADKRTQLGLDDLVMTNSGTIGRMAIAGDIEKTRKTTFQKSVAIIKPKKAIISSKYLYYYFLCILPSLQMASNGSAQKNLLLKDMRSLQIPLPKLSEQQQIVSVLFKLDQKIDIENNQRKHLALLKNGLMQDIFSQKVQIN